MGNIPRNRRPQEEKFVWTRPNHTDSHQKALGLSPTTSALLPIPRDRQLHASRIQASSCSPNRKTKRRLQTYLLTLSSPQNSRTSSQSTPTHDSVPQTILWSGYLYDTCPHLPPTQGHLIWCSFYLRFHGHYESLRPSSPGYPSHQTPRATHRLRHHLILHGVAARTVLPS